MSRINVRQMKIVTRRTDELIPYANNVNIHEDEQIDQIVESIKEFGFNDPVGVWTNAAGDTEIVEGHGRVLAAKRLGIEELPVIYLDNLTDEQRRAYSIIHNQLTRNSEFDLDLLDKELGSIDLDLDWEDFGLERIDIDFEDFDGDGDGGGSMMTRGGKVRVVIGALILDIDDPSHEMYERTRDLDPETVGAYVADALRHDRWRS